MITAQVVGRASRLSAGRLALGPGNAGETPEVAGGTPAPLPEQFRFVRADPYESTQYLREYLLLHYGRPSELCAFPFVPRGWLRFHERLREEYLLPLHPGEHGQGLDLGCAVGRFTFELGRVLDKVLGLDRSSLFIRTARRMAKQRALDVRTRESGTVPFAPPGLAQRASPWLRGVPGR